MRLRKLPCILASSANVVRMRPRRLRWWVEVGLTLALYLIYSGIRNQFGSSLGEAGLRHAFENAQRVISFEKALGLYFEEEFQAAFLGSDAFIIFWNVFYGTLHFGATIAVLVYLFRTFPERYTFMRTALASMTGLALFGFALFPLMPPRLMSSCTSQFGACDLSYSYVDTLVTVGGPWSFESDSMQSITNQFAAMPSLHIGWSLWCVVAALPVLRNRWARWGLASYPALTMFSIIVTANHFWLDAVGGIGVLCGGLLLATRLTRLLPGPPGTLFSDAVGRTSRAG